MKGRSEKAAELFTNAESALKGFKVLGAEAFLDAMRGHISVGNARTAMREGNTSIAQARLTKASATLEKHLASEQKGVRRFAAKLLEQAIANT